VKGPIFHKLLYRLSKEQRKQFFGEGFTLNKAVEMQDHMNTALDNIFFHCPTCNDHIPGRVTGQVTTDNMTRSCSLCGEDIELFFIELVSPQEIQEVVLNYYGFEKKHHIEHVHDILAELRAIPEDLSITADGRYFTELVSGLFNELKCVLDDIVEELTCQFERFEIINFKSPIQDRRRRIRTRSAFLFKNLPDFSGCEDEAGLTEPSVKQINSFSKSKKLCITRQLHYLPHLIPLSNLRMTD
jgi:transcription elongation factor Elf1